MGLLGAVPEDESKVEVTRGLLAALRRRRRHRQVAAKPTQSKLQGWWEARDMMPA